MGSTDPYDVVVPDLSSVWLGVACENYTTADLALWKARTAIGDRRPSVTEQAQLDQFQARRFAAYEDVVEWVRVCEADRDRMRRQQQHEQQQLALGGDA